MDLPDSTSVSTNYPTTRSSTVAVPQIDRSPESAVFSVCDLKKSFGDVRALRNCTLQGNRGEIVAIVGENGSGKSTLAKILGGLLQADAGAVDVLGARSLNPALAQRLGVAVVMQEILLVDSASVLENLYMGRDGVIRPGGWQQRRRNEAGKLLAQLLDGRPLDLDVGAGVLPLSTRQWIVIARALLLKAKLLVFDESTAALDAASVQRFQTVVKDRAKAGASVVIVTHRIEELPGFVDRAWVLRDGETVGSVARDQLSESFLVELMSGRRRQGPDVTERSTAGKGLDKAAPPLKSTRILRFRGAKCNDLEVRGGEVLGIASLEGHGGAEALEALAGIRQLPTVSLEYVTSGKSYELRSQQQAVRLGIVYVSGDRRKEGIFPNLNILDNFGMPLYPVRRRGPFVDRTSIKSDLEREGRRLDLQIQRFTGLIGTLSGGNQQKVLIGRALAQGPSVLLLNDPNRGVDIPTKREIYKLIKELSDGGLAVAVFSTEIEELLAVSDRIAVFWRGTVASLLTRQGISSTMILSAMFGQNVELA